MTVPHAVVTFSMNPTSSSPLLPAVICSVATLMLLVVLLMRLLAVVAVVPTPIVDDDDDDAGAALTRCFRFDMGWPIPVKAWPRATIERATTRATMLAG